MNRGSRGLSPSVRRSVLTACESAPSDTTTSLQTSAKMVCFETASWRRSTSRTSRSKYFGISGTGVPSRSSNRWRGDSTNWSNLKRDGTDARMIAVAEEVRYASRSGPRTGSGRSGRERCAAMTPVVRSAAVAACLLVSTAAAVAQNGKGPSHRTPWGHPDLQGIWTNSTITPLERPAAFAGREFMTEEEARKLDQAAATQYDQRSGNATADVNAAYNQFWWERGGTVSSRRTSLIVD